MSGSTPGKEGGLFSAAIGLLALAAGILGFAALFWIEIPARNENALMFAMGIVFGWGSAVIASEYGATTVGRKVAESAVRNIERQNAGPSGTEEDPVVVAGTEKGEPIPVKETKK
jgi:drug/metabolite transporter (DMT)-like permease